MATLPIYVVPHPVLKRVADPVSKITDDHRKLVENMLDTMYAAPGIGLAAPQIGESLRILVLDVDQPRAENEDEELPVEKRRGKPQVFINPVVLWSSEEMNVYDEGCLSIPGQYAEVERPKIVRVKAIDQHGKEFEAEADGLFATCLQHEIDHLNGILFTDHLSSLKRDMVMRKLKKFTKENLEELQKTHVL
ncbi:MAG: peptide deformylase [Alphaproteobacteria bacterium]|jgi:peptide deformylase|nr:peptide deformylase [Alphaproteobacteria bacterium]